MATVLLTLKGPKRTSRRSRVGCQNPLLEAHPVGALVKIYSEYQIIYVNSSLFNFVHIDRYVPLAYATGANEGVAAPSNTFPLAYATCPCGVAHSKRSLEQLKKRRKTKYHSEHSQGLHKGYPQLRSPKINYPHTVISHSPFLCSLVSKVYIFHTNWDNPSLSAPKRHKLRFKRLDLRFLEIGALRVVYLLRESSNFQESQVKSFETHFSSLKLNTLCGRQTLKSGCLSLLTIHGSWHSRRVRAVVRVWLGFGLLLGVSVSAIDSLTDAVYSNRPCGCVARAPVNRPHASRHPDMIIIAPGNCNMCLLPAHSITHKTLTDNGAQTFQHYFKQINLRFLKSSRFPKSPCRQCLTQKWMASIA
eukprot:sb/3466011/